MPVLVDLTKTSLKKEVISQLIYDSQQNVSEVPENLQKKVKYSLNLSLYIYSQRNLKNFLILQNTLKISQKKASNEEEVKTNQICPQVEQEEIKEAETNPLDLILKKISGLES